MRERAVSLPTRERELKPALLETARRDAESLPTRERELKPPRCRRGRRGSRSLPTRERELKHRDGIGGHWRGAVAPYTGA